ncbi:unnamed protein product, partial [Nesidiocoris tenuis]
MYVEYCKNKPESNSTLVSYGGAYFEELQKKGNVEHPIAAYLIKPVQRITKYQLLLKDLQSCCDEGQGEIKVWPSFLVESPIGEDLSEPETSIVKFHDSTEIVGFSGRPRSDAERAQKGQRRVAPLAPRRLRRLAGRARRSRPPRSAPRLGPEADHTEIEGAPLLPFRALSSLQQG